MLKDMPEKSESEKILNCSKDLLKVYNQMSDVYDKQIINEAIARVKDPRDRSLIIDKII